MFSYDLAGIESAWMAKVLNLEIGGLRLVGWAISAFFGGAIFAVGA